MALVPALVAKTVRDYRRAAIGWTVGLALLVTGYVSAYGQLQTAASAKEQLLPEAVKKIFGMQDMTSGAGYLDTTVFALVGPLLVIMAAVTFGARTIAEPESSGTIDMLLAFPIRRSQFLWQRIAVFLLDLLILGVVVWALVLALATGQDMGVSAANITAAALGLFLLGLFYGMVAVAAGAITGNRATTLAMAGGVAVGTYALNALSRIVDGGGWLHWLSPFHYAFGNTPLRNGFDAALVALAGLSVVTAVIAFVAFNRRDVGV